jgi:hypothetical protein
LLRRSLLGLVTALIVARPLVLGEDPGLTFRLTDGSNLVLSLLWMAAAVGWAAWRAWSRQGVWIGDLVQVGLVATLGAVGVSTFGAASYRHPAYLITWEWVVLLAAYCLVRQVSRTPAENQRLLAAVLASGVSLSAYAVWQYADEMPRLRSATAEVLGRTLAEQGVSFDANDPRLLRRIQEENVYATFGHPNAFAGYLALLFPVSVGAYLECGRRRRRSWQTVLVAGAALFTGMGLWLTHSRGAILGVILAGGLVLLPGARQGRKALLPIVALAMLTGAGLVASRTEWGRRGLELAGRSLGKRLDYWSATWRMITDARLPSHFWLGVGPGNFSRIYPRYMAETVDEQVTDPHNFALETWSTTGLVGLVALLATLALLLAKLCRTGGESDARRPVADEGFGTRWEFYLGGMAGLILGFVLSSLPGLKGGESAWEILETGLVAGGRGVLWFAAFALFETVPWTPGVQRRAILAGVLALLFNLGVSGGIALPSVAQPLWIMAALGSNAVCRRVPRPARTWLGVVLPLPLLAAACLFYALTVCVPVSRCQGNLAEVARLTSRWTRELDPAWRASLEPGADTSQRLAVVDQCKRYVDRVVLPRLRTARELDPTNVDPWVDLAFWYGEKWKLAPDLETRARAEHAATEAVRIDPEGKGGYLAAYRLNLLFAQFSDRQTRFLLDRAAASLKEVVRRDPTEARLRYQLADLLARAGDDAEARHVADEALRLDAASTEPLRRLTETQRKQAERWRRGEFRRQPAP